MNNRRKILITVLVVIIVIALALFIWWQFFRQEPVTNNVTVTPPTNNTNVVVVNAVANTAPVNQNTNTVSEELKLIRLANLFTERFGSFSSESDYQNIVDLKSYMTRVMQAWADNYVKQLRAQPQIGSFNSVVTKVLSTKILSQVSIKAEVQVTAQRREKNPDINVDQTYVQSINLEFVKEDDTWLVEKAAWQERQ